MNIPFRRRCPNPQNRRYIKEEEEEEEEEKKNKER
jgi:hypothetical protein